MIFDTMTDINTILLIIVAILAIIFFILIILRYIKREDFRSQNSSMPTNQTDIFPQIIQQNGDIRTMKMPQKSVFNIKAYIRYIQASGRNTYIIGVEVPTIEKLQLNKQVVIKGEEITTESISSKPMPAITEETDLSSSVETLEKIAEKSGIQPTKEIPQDQPKKTMVSIHELHSNEKVILNYLFYNTSWNRRDVHIDEISAKCLIRRELVEDHINRLRDKGLVTQLPEGLVSLSSDGIDFIDEHIEDFKSLWDKTPKPQEDAPKVAEVERPPQKIRTCSICGSKRQTRTDESPYICGYCKKAKKKMKALKEPTESVEETGGVENGEES